MAYQDIQEGRLVDLFPSFEVTVTTFDTAAWIRFLSRAYLTAKTHAVIDFMKGRFRAGGTRKTS